MIKSLDGANTCVVVAPDPRREGKPRVVYCLPRGKEGRTAGVCAFVSRGQQGRAPLRPSLPAPPIAGIRARVAHRWRRRWPPQGRGDLLDARTAALAISLPVTLLDGLSLGGLLLLELALVLLGLGDLSSVILEDATVPHHFRKHTEGAMAGLGTERYE
jgi:hypothetical protein